MIRSISPLVIALALAIPGAALAQQPTGGAAPPPAPVQGAPVYSPFPAALPPGGVLGGGNTTGSSSRPITGNQQDTFDLGPKPGGGGTVHGSDNGPVWAGGGLSSVSVSDVNTEVHQVRKGDTLWGICDSYFRNPYQWPRIWAYNPQIQNPHWIYPGDQVRLKGDAVIPSPQTPSTPAPAVGSLVDRRRKVPLDTIFLRDSGFIDDEDKINWGEITGAREDKMFLSDLDEVYVRIGPDHDVKIGDELTVFRTLRKVPGGNMIAIQGTVKVDQWNAKERVARAQVIESMDPIERGARIGPVMRRIQVVAPVRNDVDVRAQILASIVPHPFYGREQVVFIDKGETAGLKPGNRLFVVRRGDSWHTSMATPRAATRIAIESENPAETERIAPRDDKTYPEEVVGELRVLVVRKGTSTCYLTRAAKEIEIGDSVVARKGY